MNLYRHKKTGGLFYLAEQRIGWCGHYAIDYYTGKTKSVNPANFVKVGSLGGR